MNQRNTFIAAVLFAFVLAGVSVGTATFMSAKDIQAVREDAAKSAGDLQAKIDDTVDLASTMAPASNAKVDTLTATGRLWMKGRLVVTDETGEYTLFEVDPGNGTFVVDTTLTAVGVYSNFVKSDRVDATKVTADALTNRTGEWQVDESGDMLVNSIKTGDITVEGDMHLDGERFNAGHSLNFKGGGGPGGTALFEVKGTMKAIEFKAFGPTENLLFASGVDFKGSISASGALTADSLRTTAGNFVADSTGLIVNKAIIGYAVIDRTQVTTLTAGSGTFTRDLTSSGLATSVGLKVLKSAGGDAFTVSASSGDAVASSDLSVLGDLDVTGDITGKVTTRNLIVKDSSGSADVFVVSDTGADLDGDLAVDGDLTSSGLATSVGLKVLKSAGGDAFTVSASSGDAVASSDLSVLGDLDVTGDITGKVTTRNLIVKDSSGSADVFVVSDTGADLDGDLVVSGNLTAGTYDNASGGFVVDASGNLSAGAAQFAGGARADGFRTLADEFMVDGSGNMVSAEATVGGDLYVGGVIYGTLADSGTLTKANLQATNSIRLVNGGNKFTVDNSGNTFVAGTLQVDGATTLNGATQVNDSLTVTGATSLADLSASGNATVAGDATIAGDVTASGTVRGSNLPPVLRTGIAAITSADPTVTVSAMPSTASVVVTPRFSTANPFYVTVSDGDFVIHGDDGGYSWIASW